MKERIIKDIIYYESDIQNISGNSLPHNVGTLYKFSNEVHAIGQRIARKLNEYNFVSGDYDHLYINYTTVIIDGQIVISERRPEKWLIYIDYGISPDNINCLTEEEKNNFVIESTFKILYLLYNGQDEKTSIIDKVRNEINTFSSDLEIFFKTKETASYKIDISYKIGSHGKTSPLIINYLDKKRGTGFKEKVLDMHYFDDVYPLVDGIAIKSGYIILSPKKSYKAELYNKRYNTPIEIKIVAKQQYHE